jgi:hypothetical protein
MSRFSVSRVSVRNSRCYCSVIIALCPSISFSYGRYKQLKLLGWSLCGFSTVTVEIVRLNKF